MKAYESYTNDLQRGLELPLQMRMEIRLSLTILRLTAMMRPMLMQLGPYAKR